MLVFISRQHVYRLSIEFSDVTCEQVMPVLEQLCCLLRHPYRAVRHLAARCVATLSALDTPAVMDVLVRCVVSQLSAADCVTRRQGAAECLACVAERLQLQIIPYIVLLVVPLLGELQQLNLTLYSLLFNNQSILSNSYGYVPLRGTITFLHFCTSQHHNWERNSIKDLVNILAITHT